MRILYIAGAIALAAFSSYIGIAYYGQKQLSGQLNQVLDDTLKEKEQIQASAEQLQSRLKEKEDQLAGLQDVQSIKSALTIAQSNVDNLSKELSKANRDRAVLADNNVSLNTRLANTTKEYMRALNELKSAQDQAARLNKEQSPDKRKLDDLNKKIEDKNKDLSRQKAELDRLKADSQALSADNKALESKLRSLESQRSGLAAKIGDLQGNIGSREAPAKELQGTIASLREELSRKGERVAELEDKLKDRENELMSASDGKIDPQARKALSEMRSSNEKLKAQVADLNDQLNNERSRSARASAGAKTSGDRKIEDVKAEMDRLSGILVKKEFEIETARKEAMSSKEELLALQAKLTGMQNTLYSSRVNQDRLKELEEQKASAQAQLNQVQQELSSKNELVASLQKNVDYLTSQAGKKDREKAALDAKLSLLESSSQGELVKEKKRGEEAVQMYNSLKAQISQFSDAIALKEAEIENRRKEIAELKEEAGSLKNRSSQLENDLQEAKDSQKKLMGDLSAAVRLNAVLQERIRYSPSESGSDAPGSYSEEKRKADEMKKKVEVILEPEKQ